jgi:hypothetical protein
MKHFYCDCGHRIFFENTQCLNCRRALGFDPSRMAMVTLKPVDGGMQSRDGTQYSYCQNQESYGNCNWLLPAETSDSLCQSCGMNRVIPNLSQPNNLMLWTRVEEAKRRLLYSLHQHQLPFDANDTQMNFRIMEDQRRNPDVWESFIATGHLDGTITINVAEADDVARNAIREQLQERYRTVLGHMRHESGHFYFPVLAKGDALDRCRALFGDERENYSDSLERYYAQGPARNWHENFVSAYASSHPAEDFAETFAHVLHIDDALETARASGLTPSDSLPEASSWIDEWVRLSITLNEVLRSLGTEDPYPFVLTDAVREKLAFVSRLLNPPRRAEPAAS